MCFKHFLKIEFAIVALMVEMMLIEIAFCIISMCIIFPIV